MSMRLIQTITCAAVAGAVAFTASKASAFPLYLKSLSGTITYTTNYDAITNVDSAKYLTKRINLKTLMTLISDTVVLNGYAAPPKDAQIAFNPYTGNDVCYLTNSTGYYQQLNGVRYGSCEAVIDHIATSFKAGKNSGNEKDTIQFDFFVQAYDANTNQYYFEVYGPGKLKYSGNSKKVSMQISAKGGGYGEVAGSDDGVSNGKVKFSGTAAQPEWSGPFSTYWWYHSGL